MEVTSVVNAANPPPPTQTNQGQAATAGAGAVRTLQNIADQVVTSANAPTDPNVRDDDNGRPNGDGSSGSLAFTPSSLSSSAFSTRVGYDAEEELVFLEILTPEEDKVIRRIPSEFLVEFLAERFGQGAASDPNGSVSQSV